MRREKEALIEMIALSTMLNGPYSTLDLKMPRPKPQRGMVVRCSICGKSGGTLYNAGEKKICGSCRKEQNDEKERV